MDLQAHIAAIHPLRERSPAAFLARLPGSKSYSNRALVLAALRPGTTTLPGALHCDDTRYLAQCLDAFDGLAVEHTEAGFRVERRPGPLGAPAVPLYAGAAGTPARFLIAFAVAARGESVVTGNEQLCARPMGDLVEALRELGIHVEYVAGEGHLPVRVRGGTVSRSKWRVRGDVSSQFASALILLAAQQNEPIEISTTSKLVSAPYVRMTLSMLEDHGIHCESHAGGRFTIHPGVPRHAEIPVEVDASGMSYFLVAAAITGTTVRVEGIDGRSAQGDVGLAYALERMGCRLEEEPRALQLTGGPLRGIEIDMEDMPDVVLSLAIAACVAEGETRITNIANLRVKESDRIHAAATELARLGVEARQGPDFLVIRPAGPLRPARVESYDDHRVAMAFGLCRLLAPGIEISDPGCVTKSFPGYWQELARFVAHHEQE